MSAAGTSCSHRCPGADADTRWAATTPATRATSSTAPSGTQPTGSAPARRESRVNKRQEKVTIFAERVDDWNDRRYEVSITVYVPAESIGEAIEAVIGAVKEIGVA